MSPAIRISAAAARRIALAAQGFSSAPRPPARPPGLAQITAMVRRLGLLQLDSVNVFTRAHLMPLYSRLGPYDTALLDRIAGHGAGRIDRRLVEYWAHEASLVPVETHPLLRWRMADLDGAWGSMRRILAERPGLVADTLELVRERGPIRARDTGIPRRDPRPGEMWNWHAGKVALEHLFYVGRIGAARRINFERHYDLIERILAPAILDAPTPPRADAERELMRIAARSLGVAAEPDLGDVFRLSRASSKARTAELVASGELIEVSVAGWEVPGLLWHEARRPRPLPTRALLSPFDSLVFFRPRTQRLFDFRYRIEIYTPAARRVYGYYVLPFLLDEALVARVDLKSDRRAGRLRVQGAFAEPGVDRRHVARELAAELALCAGWLGLEGVSVADHGDLAPLLAAML
ncbi:MAG TPA: crosslink repair DNA glycosylase YcaQ family protein [Solirubrobacteraceae bacterium]|nr:crosslink repair DNA glycosylase YcaQ family protein [Solirubrobacteraceae bacterium]